MWLLKIRAQQYIRAPLLQILDPPLLLHEEMYWQIKIICYCMLQQDINHAQMRHLEVGGVALPTYYVHARSVVVKLPGSIMKI